MTVSTTTRKSSYPLDGVEDEFDFTFRALVSTPEDIKCSVTTGGATTILTYAVDYTVSINSNGIGGKVTLASPSSVGLGTLTVYRETTDTQSSDYDDYNQFPANTLEEDLDRRTCVDQEQTENFDRCLKFPITSAYTNPVLPEPQAGYMLGWNANLTISNIAISTLVTTETVLRGSFTNATLSSGTLNISHSKGDAPVSVTIYKNTGARIYPEVLFFNNYVAVKLSPWGTITGTWQYLLI